MANFLSFENNMQCTINDYIWKNCWELTLFISHYLSSVKKWIIDVLKNKIVRSDYKICETCLTDERNIGVDRTITIVTESATQMHWKSRCWVSFGRKWALWESNSNFKMKSINVRIVWVVGLNIFKRMTAQPHIDARHLHVIFKIAWEIWICQAPQQYLRGWSQSRKYHRRDNNIASAADRHQLSNRIQIWLNQWLTVSLYVFVMHTQITALYNELNIYLSQLNPTKLMPPKILFSQRGWNLEMLLLFCLKRFVFIVPFAPILYEKEPKILLEYLFSV